jgi:hypothetical protein
MFASFHMLRSCDGEPYKQLGGIGDWLNESPYARAGPHFPDLKAGKTVSQATFIPAEATDGVLLPIGVSVAGEQLRLRYEIYDHFLPGKFVRRALA